MIVGTSGTRTNSNTEQARELLTNFFPPLPEGIDDERPFASIIKAGIVCFLTSNDNIVILSSKVDQLSSDTGPIACKGRVSHLGTIKVGDRGPRDLLVGKKTILKAKELLSLSLGL